jgi:polar amino acid transport system substrate-binding protein
MRSGRSLGALAVAAVFVVAACGSSNTSPSAGASSSARPSASAAGSSPTAGGSPAASPSPSGSAAAPSGAIANVPTDQLVFQDRLLICTDFPYPPQEFFDDQGNPIGSDVEIGQEIGKRLGLEVSFVNSVFNTIIPALTGGKCDIIISAQNITAARKKQVDMITYFQAGQSFLVAKGNPMNIKTQQDLCGKAIAAETGTTEVDYLNGTNDYEGQGLSEQCTKAGQGKISVKTFPKDSDALLALQGGQVDAYFADSPVAGFYALQHADAFELSGLTLGVAKEGISVAKDHPELRAAVQRALSNMVNDGTYLQILQKYGLESGNVFAK